MLTIDLQSRQPIYEQLIYRMSELVALGALAPVSYTHLTLPTNREVEISVGVVLLKKTKISK